MLSIDRYIIKKVGDTEKELAIAFEKREKPWLVNAVQVDLAFEKMEEYAEKIYALIDRSSTGDLCDSDVMTLTNLAENTDTAIRVFVANQSITTQDTLVKLATDENKKVSEMAKHQLKQRRQSQH